MTYKKLALPQAGSSTRRLHRRCKKSFTCWRACFHLARTAALWRSSAAKSFLVLTSGGCASSWLASKARVRAAAWALAHSARSGAITVGSTSRST